MVDLQKKNHDNNNIIENAIFVVSNKKSYIWPICHMTHLQEWLVMIHNALVALLHVLDLYIRLPYILTSPL